MFEEESEEDFQKRMEYEEKAREAHPPEFTQAQGEVLDEEGNKWSPQLHLVMHSATLRQIDEWDLAEEVFNELQETYNLHEHAAIHALSTVTTGIIYGMLQEPDDANPDRLSEEYNDKHAEKLKALLDPDSELHQKHVEPRKDGEPPFHKSIQ